MGQTRLAEPPLHLRGIAFVSRGTILDLLGAVGPRRLALSTLGLGLGVALLTGCGDSLENGVDEAPGAADDYRGPTSREFLASASDVVMIEGTLGDQPEEMRLARAQQLASAHLYEVGYFLNLFLQANDKKKGVSSWGNGFHASARNASLNSFNFQQVDEYSYGFDFDGFIAGPNDLLQQIGGEPQPDGSIRLEFPMPILSNDDLLEGSWSKQYLDWRPDGVPDDQLNVLDMTLQPAPRSTNAWPDYSRLYEDGELRVGIQFGWDYNKDRFDVSEARDLYNALVAAGFTSPVNRFESLQISSGPLIRQGTYNGRPVVVGVTLIHPGMVGDPAANGMVLRDTLINLLGTRELVIFDGHSSTKGELTPADWVRNPQTAIYPQEYANLTLYPGYQVLQLQACQTYSLFTDAFRRNSQKQGPDGELVDLDLITSVAGVWLGQLAEQDQTVLFALTGGRNGVVSPQTWDDILVQMNAPPNQLAFMGINGIDNDPHLHPFARLDLLGTPCRSAAQCGGEGNFCVLNRNYPQDGALCAPQCTDDVGCPDGYRCAGINRSGTPLGSACVRS
jgi:hypothetical protein